MAQPRRSTSSAEMVMASWAPLVTLISSGSTAAPRRARRAAICGRRDANPSGEAYCRAGTSRACKARRKAAVRGLRGNSEGQGSPPAKPITRGAAAAARSKSSSAWPMSGAVAQLIGALGGRAVGAAVHLVAFFDAVAQDAHAAVAASGGQRLDGALEGIDAVRR